MVFQKLRAFIEGNLKLPRDGNIDDEFHMILQVFYAFGLYQPSPTKWRIVYGAVMFVFTITTVFTGAMKNIMKGSIEGETLTVVLNAAILSFSFILQNQMLTVAFYQKKIDSIMRDYQHLHKETDEVILEKYHRTYLRIIQVYGTILLSAFVFAFTMKVAGLEAFTLIIPAIYDEFAEGNLFELFLGLNIIHTFGVLTLLAFCDLFQNLCLLRIEASLDSLIPRVQSCADNPDPAENELQLIQCVQYHCKILA